MTTFICGCNNLAIYPDAVYVGLFVHETVGLSFTGSLCILGTKYIVCISILHGSTSSLNSPFVMILSCRHDSRYWLKHLAISRIESLLNRWYFSVSFRRLYARLRYCDVAMTTVVSPLSALKITIHLFLTRFLRAFMFGLEQSTDKLSMSKFMDVRLHLSNLLALPGMLCVCLSMYFSFKFVRSICGSLWKGFNAGAGLGMGKG